MSESARRRTRRAGVSVFPTQRVVRQMSVPLLDKRNAKLIWLHWSAERWWDIFIQWNRAHAWVTDAEEDGNPVVVDELTVWLGWWDDVGRKSERFVDRGVSEIHSPTRSYNSFPFPLMPYPVCARGDCEGPRIRGWWVCDS